MTGLRLSRALLAAVSSAVLATGLSACGSSGGSDDASVTSTTLRVVDPLELTLLESRIIDVVPQGFALVPDDDGETGPTDLVKAVADQGGGADVREFFVANRFSVGYQRMWSNPIQDQLLLFLYQFESGQGAQAQLDVIESSIRSNAGRTPLRSFSPGVPGSVGIENADPAGPVVAVLFSKGPYWVMMRLSGPDTALLRTQLTNMAQEQYDRLP